MPQTYLRPHVTLTFDPKVYHFMPLPRGPLVPICIKISSKYRTMFTSLVIDERTDGQNESIVHLARRKRKKKHVSAASYIVLFWC